MSLKPPIAVNGLIPHRPPMLTVGELTALENDSAVSRTIFGQNSPFADERGQIEEAVLFEMMAQTFAAAVAAEYDGHGPTTGYLVGVKHMKFHGRARTGQAVEIKIEMLSQVEDFSVIFGQASQRGALLADGQLTVYIPRDEV